MLPTTQFRAINTCLKLALAKHIFWQGVNRHRRANLTSDLAEVAMMGEVDDLSRFRHFREQAEGFLRAEVVKGLHDVVGDEGNRASGFGELGIAGDAQGKVKLIAGSPGHLGHQLRTLVRGDGDQNFALFVRLSRQAHIGATADGAKRFGSARHHGGTMLLSVQA